MRDALWASTLPEIILVLLNEGQPMRSECHVVSVCGTVLLSLCLVTSSAAATMDDRVALWPGVAPCGDGPPVEGNAFVTVYHPDVAKGPVVVICPGGGYGGLALEAEGHGIARWLNQHGVTGVVLEYRLPNGNRFVPLLDAQRAIRWTRAAAASWNCDPARVVIIGFSAGGHLAATAATHFDAGDAQSTDPIERWSCRPDAEWLIYPVITMGDKTHLGSRRNLLGPEPTADIIEWYSNERQVTEQTPPAFIAHPRDDRVVPVDNARAFHRALRAHHVDSRYLELPYGDHGLRGYRGPTWDAWQSGALQWMIDRQWLTKEESSTTMARDGAMTLPTLEQLNAGAQRVVLLPGLSSFVFSLYGVPSDADSIRELVDIMRERQLGNGFDPGPGPQAATRATLDFLAANGWPVVFYSGAEMQIKGGRAVFGREQEEALAAFDRIGVFSAFQLGEWGYYFHNLSHRESWWRDVYGQEYDSFKHLKKPAGLAGYDRQPTSKQECYEIVHDYFTSRCRDLLGRVISVTGHSHYEAYAGQWGARCIGLELGENIAFTQSKLAFARGASRQTGKPWSVQVSPWFGPAVTTHGPLRKEGTIVQGLDAGHSLSLYERLWLHAWFAGAAMVTPENSISSFFEQPAAPWTFTPHGQKAAETYAFMVTHPRGVPYTPVAIVLDRYAGYNGYMDKPWGILNPTVGDREARDLFDHQLFPGSDHIHSARDAANPESSYLRPTPFGELFDVVLTSAPPDLLATYPVLLLVGDIEWDPVFLTELEKSLRRGCRVVMSDRHRAALGADFQRLALQGNVEVLSEAVSPTTGRTMAIADSRLREILAAIVPFQVDGDPVQFAMNRTDRGWVVELINNRGVIKRGDTPAIIDPEGAVQVTVVPRVPLAHARAWRSQREWSGSQNVELKLSPGEVEYIEWTESTP